MDPAAQRGTRNSRVCTTPPTNTTPAAWVCRPRQGVQSHSIVEQGLLILKNLDHQGAVGADPLMGDGAGLLIQIPDQLYRDEMASQGVTLPPVGEYGVGMYFMPQENACRAACQEEIERAIRAEGQVLLGWRDVPVSSTMPMSPTVKKNEPVIRQVFVGRGPDVFVTDALERKLYVIRRRATNAIKALKLDHSKEFYVNSFSARTIVAKGYCCWPTRSASTTSTCRTRAAYRRSPWCTSASRPTPSRAGIWPTCSG